ncbi:hypothetical protein GCM10010211_50870 [Streptomyces albospinus]|uniref:Uncharacterized protein n=1 Tax=Streptomyces albospinus TaxID=285515 RepID=A0ABQ2VDS5_9ACTN|nr:hypothetical protein [Streptomyces albospinus]GGU78782.1 hypothetical protein GCM10010211_50870 [Streptomyces albospinus]
MSADADFADARHIPPIPPQPPHRPAGTPVLDEDPQTTVLRPVPADPTVPPPAAPPGPAAPPTRRPMPAAAPPRPATPPGTPPRPRTEPPAAPPPPTGRPASFRDTAAFHLAHSEALWSDPRDRAPGTPPSPDRGSPQQSSWPSTPAASRAVGPAPAAARRRPLAGLAGRLPTPRVLAAAACLVLGVGLLGGAAAGSWLTDDTDHGTPNPDTAFAKGQDAWHSAPVDSLFPRVVDGLGVGPGGADRQWTRIAVAPDTDCSAAYEGPLAKELATAGCARLLRATYVDATRTSVITVGAQTTRADRPGMMDLNARFSTHNLATRADLMPLPLAAKGTPAADFGPAQRASWTIRVLTDIPVVVYAVSGFADGREIPEPQPAEAAVQPGTATTPGESGLGHDAKDLADKVETTFRTASGIPAQPTEEAP